MKMKRVLLLLLTLGFAVALIACEPDEQGVCTYDISSYETPHTIGSARVYYPCDIDTLDKVHSTTLTSGMGGSKENMYWLADPIAAEGMVAITVSAANNMAVSGYERAHKSGVAILQDENADPTSPLYGKIDSYGVMGYSMGGGGSVNAATDLGDEVETCIALAPYTPNPGANHSAATLILTGTADTVAPAYMGENAYRELDYIDARGYASMRGAGHMFWANNSSPGTADDYIVAWLKYFGEEDTTYGATIENPGSDMTDVQLDAPPLSLTGGSSNWWW
jgi:dienelactone hydrolase